MRHGVSEAKPKSTVRSDCATKSGGRNAREKPQGSRRRAAGRRGLTLRYSAAETSLLRSG